jgi:glycosyltransferase involved in cell wall biosynthesis
MLEEFSRSLKATASPEQLVLTECIVGIDMDDRVFQSEESRDRIRKLLPCQAVFVEIRQTMYGCVCKIWNFLASKARNDFIVLLGDDVKLIDADWQQLIVMKFRQISSENNLPFGAACVSMNDLSFPGFPTFPVIHRWHMRHFGSLLPRQFVNQGGDPYLYELYSRFNASAFCVPCRLENTIGGDGDARYEKHQITWCGQILNMNLRKLKTVLGDPKGIVLDIVVPSYRTNNNAFLDRIAKLRATCQMYVRFWFVVDNPKQDHITAVKQLANELNAKQLQVDANYFISVIHYDENRGASYARNTGFNYSTADWVLFLDDDVIPDEHILDAYAGALRRYPDAKVFVGQTELPSSFNMWTAMLQTCNVGYFYGIAKQMIHPSWGVTANLMVRGSRFNHTIQFKGIYPKTGGGEDIDLVYQFKEWYRTLGRRVTVGVPEAKVQHPWWNQGKLCYRQITGWAWGDSLCITEWRKKTFMAFPNWIEHIAFVLAPLTVYTGKLATGLTLSMSIVFLEHAVKCIQYYPETRRVIGSDSCWKRMWVAFGAGSVLSAQEITRVVALIHRGSIFSLCRRVDWFDGQEERIKLDIQLASFLRFGLHAGLTWVAFCWGPRQPKSS